MSKKLGSCPSMDKDVAGWEKIHCQYGSVHFVHFDEGKICGD